MKPHNSNTAAALRAVLEEGQIVLLGLNSIAMREGASLRMVAEANIVKLRERWPDGFPQEPHA